MDDGSEEPLYSEVAPRYEGHAVLVIDDSKLQRRILERILGDLGFGQVQLAATGEEALDRAQASAFDVVLVDWNVPGIEGAALLRALREAQPGAKFIVVSAETDLGVMEEALASGADEYLMKPAAPDLLRAKLALLDDR
ncbi:MAG: response regulator [Myxococcota bacterium]